jgi:AAA domain
MLPQPIAIGKACRRRRRTPIHPVAPPADRLTDALQGFPGRTAARHSRVPRQSTSGYDCCSIADDHPAPWTDVPGSTAFSSCQRRRAPPTIFTGRRANDIPVALFAPKVVKFPMLIRRLAIENVRSFLERREMLFDGQISIIIGPNGGGKTNLLDTAYTLLRRYLFATRYPYAVDGDSPTPRWELRHNDQLNQIVFEKHSLGKARDQLIELEIAATLLTMILCR